MSRYRIRLATVWMALLCVGTPAGAGDLTREMEAVRQHVGERLSVDVADVEVLHLGLSDGFACAEGADFFVESSPAEDFKGHVDLRLMGLEESRPCGSARVRSRIRVWKTVAVVQEQALAGTKIVLGEARVMMESIHGIPLEPGTGPWEARVDMAKGSVATTNRVRPFPDSRTGDPVIIEAGSGGLRVTAAGRLLEDGCLGDRVRVANLTTDQVMVGVLIESGRVRAGGEG
jgi:flagella basal body P-ring formation protein FlgA